jgi:biotin transport system substrate-specific component
MVRDIAEITRDGNQGKSIFDPLPQENKEFSDCMLQEKISPPYPKTRGLALCALFAVLLSVFSLISIPLPFTIVPITLQVFMVYLVVSLLGPYYGALSCLVYLLLGAIGLPVFAGASGGLGALFGPVGGFLFAFPLSALIGGMISRNVSDSRRVDAAKVIAACALTLLLIYLVGPLWLANYEKISLDSAFLIGAVPFISVDIAKGVFAVPIALYFRRSRHDLPVHRKNISTKGVA